MRDIYKPNINKIFSLLDESVNIINQYVDSGQHSKGIDENVWKNWKHIDIMLKKDYIKNSDRNLLVYQNAVIKGLEFVPIKPE